MNCSEQTSSYHANENDDKNVGEVDQFIIHLSLTSPQPHSPVSSNTDTHQYEGNSMRKPENENLICVDAEGKTNKNPRPFSTKQNGTNLPTVQPYKKYHISPNPLQKIHLNCPILYQQCYLFFNQNSTKSCLAMFPT